MKTSRHKILPAVLAIFALQSAWAETAQDDAPRPARVILFTIDGLHTEALERVDMPVLRSLIPQGTFAPESWVIMPHHPTVGEYGRLHTTSYPNPVLMGGTVFLRPDSRFVQEAINPAGKTGFFVNSRAYDSVTRGFGELLQNPEATDEQIVDAAMTALRREDFKFMRIHLQTPGNVGRTACTYGDKDAPYHRNIWGQGSPYVEALAQADALLGKFIAFLKEQNRWDDTVLIVSSDHGQSVQGWHPVSDPDSWRTPLLFLGPGIAKDRKLSYAEHTDLAPTICKLLGVEPPNPGPGAGRFLGAVMAGHPDDSAENPRFIERVNRQNVEYLASRALLQLASAKDSYYSSQITLLENELCTPEPFYSIDRFLEWHRAGSTAHLLENNGKILELIRADAAAAAKLLQLKPEQIPWLE